MRQNVVTRLRSLTNDWFLDIDANIDWLGLLSTKGSEDQIISEIRRVVLDTENVIRINNLTTNIDRNSRKMSMSMVLTTIFSRALSVNAEVIPDGST